MRLDSRSTQIALWVIAISIGGPQVLRVNEFLSERMASQGYEYNRRKSVFEQRIRDKREEERRAREEIAEKKRKEAEHKEYLLLKESDAHRVAKICADGKFIDRAARHNHKLLLEDYDRKSSWGWVWISPESDPTGHTGYPFHVKADFAPPTLSYAKKLITPQLCKQSISYGAWPVGDDLYDISDWRDRARMSDEELMDHGVEHLSQLAVTAEIQIDDMTGKPFTDAELKEFTSKRGSRGIVDKCEIIDCD